MQRSLSDLVEDTRLECHLESSQIIHIHQNTHRLPGHQQREEDVWPWPGRRLGRGGFGTVFLQERVSGGEEQRRAVKSIEKGGPFDADQIEYRREIEAMAKFSHEEHQRCFVRFLGWFEDNAKIYLAMEYIAGGSLRSYFSASRPLAERDACIITQQILDGAQMMHDNQFAHRDLKPENILVKRQGPDWWIKLADFGLSKRLVESTALRTVAGTAAYIAPEVREIHAPGNTPQMLSTYTFAVDIWAVGIMVVEMMMGSPPLMGPMELFSYVVRGEKLELPALFSEYCAALTRDLLGRSPSARPTAGMALEHTWFRIAEKAPFATDDAVVGASQEQTLNTRMRHLGLDTLDVSSDSLTAPSGNWDSIPGDDTPSHGLLSAEQSTLRKPHTASAPEPERLPALPIVWTSGLDMESLVIFDDMPAFP